MFSIKIIPLLYLFVILSQLSKLSSQKLSNYASFYYHQENFLKNLLLNASIKGKENILKMEKECTEQSLKIPKRLSEDPNELPEIPKTCKEAKQYNYASFDFFIEALNNEENLYLMKISKDSAKNPHDLGSYSDCLTIYYQSITKSTKEIKDNLNYLIVEVDRSSQVSEKDRSKIKETQVDEKYIFGVCMPYISSCSIYDYQLLLHEAINLSDLVKDILLEDITVYQMKDKEKGFKPELIPNFIPIFIVLLVILMNLIPLIWRKKNEGKKEDEKNVLYDIFSIERNAEAMANLPDNFDNPRMHIINDNEFKSINGLRAMTMILLIISNTFYHLFRSPVKVYVAEIFANMLKQVEFVLILFGMRYACRILLALSAFTLGYKLINCFDETLKIDYYPEKENNDESEEKENDDKNEQEESKEDSKDKNKDKDEKDKQKEEEEKDNAYTDDRIQNEEPIILNDSPKHKELSILTLLRFFSLQLYKYLMFVLFVFVFKYSLYLLFKTFFVPSPLWVYFDGAILQAYNFTKHILSTLFLYTSFSNNTFFSYDLFMLAYNEIFLFLFLSLLTFICYKYMLRLDIIIIVLFFLLNIGKFVLYYTQLSLYGNDKDTTKKIFYPANTFNNSYFNFIASNPLYNLSSALIGLFFGLIYFSLQKDNDKQTTRSIIRIPKAIYLKSHDPLTNIIISSVCFIIFFGCVFLYICVYPFYDNSIIPFNENFAMNIICIFDVDLAIIALFGFTWIILLTGTNFLKSFMEHEYLNIISRPYFLFVIDLPIISYYILYQQESRIKVNTSNVLFYSLLIFIVSVVVNWILFICFEIPLRNMNKMLVKGINKASATKEELIDNDFDVSDLYEVNDNT